MSIDEEYRRSALSVQAEGDQLDAMLVDDIAATDDSFLRFLKLIETVNNEPEMLRVLLASDLEQVAYLFTRSAVDIITMVRERRKEIGCDDDECRK